MINTNAPAHIGLTSARLAPTVCGATDPNAVRLSLQDLTQENLKTHQHNRWKLCEQCCAIALGRPRTIAEQLPIPLATWVPLSQTTVLALLGWSHREPQRGDSPKAFHQRRTVLDAAGTVVDVFRADELWAYLEANGWIEPRRKDCCPRCDRADDHTGACFDETAERECSPSDPCPACLEGDR